MRTGLFISLALLSPAASGGEALKVNLVPKTQIGQGTPELVVTAQAELDELVLDLKRSTDGRRIRKKAGPIYAGREHRFALPIKRVGRATFSGTLKVTVKGGQTGSMPLDLPVEVLSELKLSVDPKDVHLKERRLAVGATRNLAKVQVSLMSDVGTPMGTTEVEVSPDASGKHLVQFEQNKGTVMRISVKGWDRDGFFGGVDLFPWRVDIPHEEVNFESGQSRIPPVEASKLEASYELLSAAIEKYGRLAKIQLFVGGHTDTVADAAYNRGLSRDRARAIGVWFRKRGVRIPIRYAGFGEDQLAVTTADNVDEPRNRRAEYIVSVEPPLVGAGTWKPLD